MTFLVRNWRAAAAIAAAAIVGALAYAPGAMAQGYSVYADCERTAGWSPGGNDDVAAYSACNGGWLSGMRTLVTPHNDARTGTGTGAWTFRAAPGTKIVGLEWDGSKYHGISSGGWIGGGWLFRTSMFGDGFRPIDGEADCNETNFQAAACYSGAFSDPNPKSVPAHYVGGLNDDVVGFYTTCVQAPNACPTNSDGLGGHNLTRAALVVSHARVDLRDDIDPAVGAMVGYPEFLRGVVNVRFDATDNSGIERTAVVDENGREIANRPRGCDWFRYPKPCNDQQGENGDHPIDTRGMTDGHHRIAARAWDAAGRPAVGEWRNVYVDNTAPSGPDNVSIDGGEGWNRSNSRAIRWGIPSGQVSSVDGAQVQVCKTGTSECRVRDVSGLDLSAAGGVSGFDGPGDYTVRVALRDQAGNFDAAKVSNGVRLRFDDLAPGAADPRKSNGWLNAVERAAYTQNVKLAEREFKPVSGIAGYSLTTDGTDPDNTVEAAGESVDYPINDLPEGVNTIKARAVSGAGVGSSIVKSAEVKVDVSEPIASVDGAPASATWQNRPVDLVLRGTDQPALSGMGAGDPTRPFEEGAYIAYRVDGGELQKVRGGQAPLTIGDEGEHTVTYYAVDFAGNQSETNTVQFKIDRTSPTAGAASDAVDPQQWQRESVTVGLSGDDGAGRSGMDPAPADEPIENGAHLVYRLDGGSVQKARGASATFKVDDDGDHAVTYYAVDGAGNESAHQELRFRIDRTAPNPVFFEHQGSDKRRLEVAAADAPSGVGDLQIGLRRVGAVAEARSLKRLAARSSARYRRAKLRGTRRVGSRPAACGRKRAAAKRVCLRSRRLRIAPLGTGWRMVPATREGDSWVAYIPNDHSLEEGVYQLEAVAQDRAGNEAAGDKFRNGQPAVIPISAKDQPNCCGSGPASGSGGLAIGLDGTAAAGDLGPDNGTIDTKVAAGAVKKVRVRPKVSKKCKKPKTRPQKKQCAKARKPRYREQFVSSLKVKYGGKAKLKGALTTAAGAPIADGTIDVITAPKADGQLPRIVGGVTSDRTGAFSYTAPAGTSRAVTFRFRGLGEYRRSEGAVNLLVPGSATLKSSKLRVANGQSVTFAGRVLGKPLPSRGKVVDLQAFYRGKWRTFATPRANKKGQFKFRYRFEATRSTTTYKFRARLRAESAYPYELGYSKVVSVRVRGR